MISKLLRFLPLLFLATLSLRAAPPASPPPLLFRTLGIGVDATDLFYVENTKLIPCTIDSQRRSPYYEAPSSGAPVLFVRVAQTPEGKEQRIPVAQAAIDPSLRRALLIFTRGADPAEPLRVLVLKDDVSAVPAGGYRVLNYLPVSAGITAGAEKQIVPSRGAAVISPKPSTGMNVYEFKVFGLTSQAAVPLYSNVFAVDPSIRTLILIVPSPSSPKQMEVKFLGESVNAIRPDDPAPAAPPPPPPR